MKKSYSRVSKITAWAFLLGALALSPAQGSTIEVIGTTAGGGSDAFTGETVNIKVRGETTTTVGAIDSMLQATWDTNTATFTDTPTVPEGWTTQYLNTSSSTWGSRPANNLVGGVRASGVFNSHGTDTDGKQILFARATQETLTGAANISVGVAGQGGDGWDVFFDAGYTKVFNVYHHSSPRKVDCHVLSTGARCSGFPVELPNSLGTNDRSTGIVIGSRLFIPAGYGTYVSGSATAVGGGFVCVNNVGGLCSTPFIRLTNVTGTGTYNNILNATKVESKVFTMNAADGKLLCVDGLTLAACSGMPSGGFNIGLTSIAAYKSHMLTLDTKVYVSDGTGKVACFDTVTNDKCANWSTVWQSTSTYTLVALPDASGAIIGICQFNNTNASTVSCVDPIAKTPVTTALTTSFITALNGVPAYSGLGGYTNTPPTVGTRVYWSDSDYINDSGRIGCWDAALNSGAGGQCVNFQGGGGTLIRSKNYTVRVDPVTPTCIWLNNNSGEIKQYDVTTGLAGCSSAGIRVRYAATDLAPRVTCAEEGRVTGWKFFNLETITGGTPGAVTLTVLNSRGLAIPGWESVTVSAFTPLSLSALTVAMTGTQPQFILNFVGGTSGAITNVTASAEYLSSAPEICFDVLPLGDCPDLSQQPVGVISPIDPIFQRESITVTAVDTNTNTASTSINRFTAGCLKSISGQTTNFDLNDSALAGVTVQVKDSAGNTTYATVQTDASGNYKFPNVMPGTYLVVFGSASGKTIKTAGSVSATVDSVTAAVANASYIVAVVVVVPAPVEVPPPLQVNSITGMTPVEGPTSGGTVVTITGDFSAPITNIEVDGVRLDPSQWRQTPTGIIITMPPHVVGPVMIQLYDGQYPLLAQRKFTYVETPAPTPTPTPSVTPTPTPTPAAQQTCKALGAVYFDTDSWTIKESTMRALTEVASLVSESGAKKACIVGHTDSRASVEYNLWLSKHRVDAVYARMKKLLPGLAITRDFKGKSDPVAVNDAPSKGMAKNRRVEIGVMR